MRVYGYEVAVVPYRSFAFLPTIPTIPLTTIIISSSSIIRKEKPLKITSSILCRAVGSKECKRLAGEGFYADEVSGRGGVGED